MFLKDSDGAFPDCGFTLQPSRSVLTSHSSHRQAGSDLLDKKVAFSGQTAQKEDKDCPLNLNPTPSYPRESVESVETEDSIENVFDFDPNPLVNPAGQIRLTVPCGRYRQAEEIRWWNPPTIWPPVRPICWNCKHRASD